MALETELQQQRERNRDLSQRLLTAQETECARIAREVHDDIGQQLAVLCLDLATSGASDAAVERAKEIAKSVAALSHRLHPAQLRLRGLVASVSALQREHARPDIDVIFTHSRGLADLPQSAALCVFRVVQEALRNAVRHSQARQILVDLRRHDSHLTVTVTDDGVGFDVEKAWGRGLGLISIRERVESAGGTMVVRSEVGSGSRFAANIPLKENHSHALAR